MYDVGDRVDGKYVGLDVGWKVGNELGVEVGWFVGDDVGWKVGRELGAVVGWF